MAELSDADKRSLLGDGYKDLQAQRDLKTGDTDQARATKARDSMLANGAMTAAGLGFIAFLIGLANYYSRGTPYSPTLLIGCVIVVAVCVAVALAVTRYRKNSSNP